MSKPVPVEKGPVRPALVGYFVVMAAGGGALCWAAASARVGGWGYGVGGLLALTGAGCLVSLFTRGELFATCPGCAHRMLYIDQKVLLCPSCARWLRIDDARAVTVIPDGEVATTPVFGAPLPPASFVWPEGCPTCGGAVTRHVPVEATAGFYVPGLLASSTTFTIQAPACDRHDQGVGLVSAVGGRHTVKFVSLAYQRRFCAANAIDTDALVDGVYMPGIRKALHGQRARPRS